MKLESFRKIPFYPPSFFGELQTTINAIQVQIIFETVSTLDHHDNTRVLILSLLYRGKRHFILFPKI